MLTSNTTKLTPSIIPSSIIGSANLEKSEKFPWYTTHELNDMIISKEAILEQPKAALLQFRSTMVLSSLE
jgi:hypothetical protein